MKSNNNKYDMIEIYGNNYTLKEIKIKKEKLSSKSYSYKNQIIQECRQWFAPLFKLFC